MYSYSLLLLAALAAVVSSTTAEATSSVLRGSQQGQQEARRKLFEEVHCRFFEHDVNYPPSKKHPNGYSKEELACEFDQEEAERIGVYSVIIDIEDGNPLENAVSGESILSISKAIIDVENFKMFLPSESAVVVKTERERERRKLQSNTKGDFKTMVVRIIDKKGKGPTKSISDLENDVFEDESCLKSQMAACSYNKLRIQPNTDYGGNGVYDLKVDHDLSKDSSRTALYNAAKKKFNEEFGSPYDKSKFDLILFCHPPEAIDSVSEKSDWNAWGETNGPISGYSDVWCGAAAGQMHEVGHNIGLGHSGEGNKEYGDNVGNMGSNGKADDNYQCYNPAKNWQLGWYDDRQETIDPLSKPVTRVTFNGVSDYKKASDGLVVVNLEPNYYLGYNRKAGMNKDTGEDADMITIHTTENNKSKKIAKLAPGNSFIIQNFQNKRDVEIKFVGIANNMRDAVVDIIDVKNKPDEEIVPCEKHIVEVKTDNYPDDNSWFLVSTSGFQQGFGESPDYTEQLKVYKTEVCLPYSSDYKFTLKDGYGDGICCSQGAGYYKITNSKNQVVVSNISNGTPQPENEAEIVKTFSVGPNPNPSNPTPTKAPTPKPTKAPTPKPTPSPTKAPPSDGDDCEEYTVEIKTDGYPGDNSWYINDSSGNKKFSVDSFDTPEKVYKKTICLNYDSNYEFVILDSWTDGMCGNHGDGYYKVMDSKGALVIDSTTEPCEFDTRTKTINVGSKPQKETPAPTPVPTQAQAPKPVCKNSSKFKLKSTSKKARTCKFFAKKNKCNVVVESTNEPVWKSCPKACEKCDSL